ncbi:GNAT family N-acetyltransferase [Bacillus sp. DX4.1]|uniref:GNAT family N-acetyltransferase n=1 Tax=Bacillus sp. DX4.1 TaxID=3055867 RepID=UPI0025A2111C|nr:GNAT family N-acetyltransferase [Bacillus sp. DX4.1]MDM5187996.1 GNAT family N-acetyltransferase [Bacillus sp. DX4.1]
MELRSINTDDYFKVIKVIDEWWGGRKMTHLLPRLFFEHFQSTSFILEIDGELASFIIGFISQTNNKEAYIHFVGVNPNYRKLGLAKKMYFTFFENVKKIGCDKVKCITTPINEGSIKFHRAMGFDVNLVENYAGENLDRIVFNKEI